jgi:hypothetical protein
MLALSILAQGLLLVGMYLGNLAGQFPGFFLAETGPKLYLTHAGPVIPSEMGDEFLEACKRDESNRFFPPKAVTVLADVTSDCDNRSDKLLIQFARTRWQTDVKWTTDRRLTILAVGPKVNSVGDKVAIKTFSREGNTFRLAVGIKRGVVSTIYNPILVPLVEVPLGNVNPGLYKIAVEWTVEPLDEFTRPMRDVQNCQLEITKGK